VASKEPFTRSQEQFEFCDSVPSGAIAPWPKSQFIVIGITPRDGVLIAARAIVASPFQRLSAERHARRAEGDDAPSTSSGRALGPAAKTPALLCGNFDTR
jgi:hypothetical protein